MLKRLMSPELTEQLTIADVEAVELAKPTLTKVEVLAKDIASDIHLVDHCPIARAIRRVGMYTEVRVSEPEIIIDGVKYETPGRLADWIHRYDLWEKTNSQPITFYLEEITG